MFRWWPALDGEVPACSDTAGRVGCSMVHSHSNSLLDVALRRMTSVLMSVGVHLVYSLSCPKCLTIWAAYGNASMRVCFPAHSHRDSALALMSIVAVIACHISSSLEVEVQIDIEV